MRLDKLDRLVKKIPAALVAFIAGDDEQVVFFLNEKTLPRSDDTSRDSNWITNNLNSADADKVLGTLQASVNPQVIAAVAKLAGNGIDLSNPKVQAMIPAMASAANWRAGLAEKVIGWGKWKESVVEEQMQVRGSKVILSQVKVYRKWRELTKRTVDNYNAAMDAIDTEQAKTWAEVEAILKA